MEIARNFWKCMFEYGKDEDEEFVYTLFSSFDDPICVHNERNTCKEDDDDDNTSRIRDACIDCLRTFAQIVQNSRSMLRLKCYRNYLEFGKRGMRFTILFYPFTNTKMCTTLDIMPDCLNSFLDEILKKNMFSYKQKDFTACEFEFNHCVIDEEIDIIERKGKLRLWLFFRFLFLESLRSKNPVQQRHKIYSLLVEYGMAEEEDKFPDWNSLFGEHYRHSKMISFYKERMRILIQ